MTDMGTNEGLSAYERLRSITSNIELFEVMGRQFCFCIPTCAFCELDHHSAFVLKELARGATYDGLKDSHGTETSEVPLDEVLFELDEMINLGLFSADINAAIPAAGRLPRVTTLSLIMATDCNLRCKYCYADNGTYHQERSIMDYDVACKAVDFLARYSRGSKEVGISFFGGEPLLNFRTIEKVVPYAEEIFSRKGQECSFGITTNGTLLTQKKVKFMEEHHFSYIVSIDGPPEIHDRYRIFPDNSGSYEYICKKLNQLKKIYPDFNNKVTIRATFTGTDYDLISRLSHLKSLGFPKISIESCAALTEHLRIDDDNIELILADYDKTAQWYLMQLSSEDPFNFVHFTQLLEQVSDGSKRISQCGAGRGYLAVSPDGALYPCHRLVGDETYAMGSVFNKADPKMQMLFGCVSVPYKEKCLKCWARFICGGGCHATAIQFNQDILQPYEIECILMKHRIKLGAWLYSGLSEHYARVGALTEANLA